MYWNIEEILPYQRRFNLINGPRSIGKTYTTLKFLIKKALFKDQEFIYLVRTQDEKKDGIFQSALAKVCQKEYEQYEFKFSNSEMSFEEKTLGYCFAISESQKIKKRSFPNVKYMVFDEYMLEDNSPGKYVKGFKEPELLLSIYQTVDRDEDRVIVFMLGNNTTFYNPYHLHPAFSIPDNIEPGELWMNKTTLFQWAMPSNELKKKKEKTDFNMMIQGTSYDIYANQGKYIEDKSSFIEELNSDYKYICTLIYNSEKYGTFFNSKLGLMLISQKVDPFCKDIYALSLDDHNENTVLNKVKNFKTTIIGNYYKQGRLRFDTMTTKKKIERIIYEIFC